MKDHKLHNLKFNSYLDKLYNSNKRLIIYKVKDGYNLYTDFSKKIVLTNNVLVLEINKKGILKNKKFYDINDLNKIDFNKNETKMSDKDSFVYGVLSSLRQKIDSPKRNKK